MKKFAHLLLNCVQLLFLDVLFATLVLGTFGKVKFP